MGGARGLFPLPTRASVSRLRGLLAAGPRRSRQGLLAMQHGVWARGMGVVWVRAGRQGARASHPLLCRSAACTLGGRGGSKLGRE